jgi:hypothetical protein
MPLLRNLATGLLGRRTARRLGRAIPNPLVRAAVVGAATTVIPLLVERALARRRRARVGAER